MTTLAHTQTTGVNAMFAVVPADLTLVCRALTGLVVTALAAACVGSVDFACFLAAAG